MPAHPYEPSTETVRNIRAVLHQLDPNEDYSAVALIELLHFNVPELRGRLHRASTLRAAIAAA